MWHQVYELEVMPTTPGGKFRNNIIITIAASFWNALCDDRSVTCTLFSKTNQNKSNRARLARSWARSARFDRFRGRGSISKRQNRQNSRKSWKLVKFVLVLTSESSKMPQGDPRRVAGPESSKDYRAYAVQKKSQGKKNHGKELHMKRSDGRDSPDKHRSLCKF